MSFAALKISDSLQEGFDAFFGFLPNLLAFLVILVVGYFIAKLVAKVVQKVAEKAGLDKALHESDAKQYVDRVMPDASPSAGIGKVFFWIIFVFVLTAAIGALKIPAGHAFHEQVLALPANVIAAIVIFVVRGSQRARWPVRWPSSWATRPQASSWQRRFVAGDADRDLS